MNPRRTLCGVFIILLAIWLNISVCVVPASATETCPTNTVHVSGFACCEGGVVFYLGETSTGPTHSVSHGTSNASYDLVDGRIHAEVHVLEAHEHRSEVTAVDVFTMHGAPSATIKVRLGIHMVWIADPSGRQAWADGWVRLTVQGVHAVHRM